MKPSFFQAAVVSILLYGCTTWTLTKQLEKKLDGNYTRMLRTILNKSWSQHPTKYQLLGHLLPIIKTIQVKRTRHAGHCWRSRDELISDVLLWTLTYGRVKAGRPARTYIQQLCEDTGCSPEDLPEAMNDREKWRERVRDISAGSTTWWWWWILFIKYSYLIQITCTQLYGFKLLIITLAKHLNSSIWPTDGTLTGTINPGQRRLKSNSNEGVLHIPKASGLESHHKKQFSIIPKTFVEEEVLPL